jgi:hypothetical protein
MNLREIMNVLETAADKNPGQTRGPLIPPLDLVYDFFVGTTSDVNMSRMVEYYENHLRKSEELSENPWSKHKPEITLESYYQ